MGSSHGRNSTISCLRRLLPISRNRFFVPAGLPGNPIWLSNLIGGRAVVFFYIVSGFLISYGLNHKYPQSPSGIRAFYRSRFLRIYPLWWVVLLICVLITPYPWTGTAAAKLAVASVLIGSDWIVAFWHYPVPYWSLFPAGSEIGWTLGAPNSPSIFWLPGC